MTDHGVSREVTVSASNIREAIAEGEAILQRGGELAVCTVRDSAGHVTGFTVSDGQQRQLPEPAARLAAGFDAGTEPDERGEEFQKAVSAARKAVNRKLDAVIEANKILARIVMTPSGDEENDTAILRLLAVRLGS